ncbi:MAG: alpha/beta hydrolase [Planctomycetaceae bacterium]
MQNRISWQKIRRRCLIAGACGLVILLTTAWFVGGTLVSTAHRIVGPPPFDANTVVTTLTSESGSSLATWYVPVENSSATVVLIHPWRGDRRTMNNRAEMLIHAGFSIVMIDLQGHGESPGEQITAGYLESHDVKAAVEFAIRQNPDHRIGLIGCSIGGAAAILASPLGIDALVIESVYPTIDDAVCNRIESRLGPLCYALAPLLLCQLEPRTGVSCSLLRPIDRIGEVGCPIMIMSGEDDLHTKMVDTNRLYDAAKPPKELVLFKGAAHVDLMDHDEKLYSSRVVKFLEDHLKPAKK